MSTSRLSRSLLKGTALFGGTQMLNMLMGVVRGKLVAVLLGTVGMGVSSIYMSTLLPLQQFFAMGIPIAIVSIVAALSSEDKGEAGGVGAHIEAARRVLLVLSLAGIVTMAAGAWWLSRASFGDDAHVLPYMLLGVALFFMIMESGETAFLQSRQMLKAVAMRGVVNAVAGLAVSIPLYWWWGMEGIVPAIIGCAFVVWLYPRWQTHRAGLGCSSQPWRETWQLGRSAIALGCFLMLAGLLGSLATYLVNVGIREMGSLADVGLYQAANSITGQCVTLVFAAMGTDFYPRLSAAKGSREDSQTLLSKEYELVLLIMAPLVVLLILATPLVIRLLLTEEFLPLTPVIRLIAVSLLCKAAYFPIGYISLAQGRRGIFFWVEGVWDNAKNVLLLLVFYHLWGLPGLGWAVLVGGLVDVAVTSPLLQRTFGLSIGRETLHLFVPLFAGVAACAAFSACADEGLAWGGMSLSALAVIGGSLQGLRRLLRG